MPEYAAKKKLSLETAAREMRYAVLNSAAKNSDYVCLAHHMNDNAETVLMHILRGSGARGAAGIKPVSNRFFRPLLDETREEIDKYAFENDIPFVYDETNGPDKVYEKFRKTRNHAAFKQGQSRQREGNHFLFGKRQSGRRLS